MANMVKKLCGIAGVLMLLLIAAAALPGRAGATSWPNVIDGTHHNPNGLGGALIYPLFTADGSTETLLAITNTTINLNGTDQVIAADCPGGPFSSCPGDSAFTLNSVGRYTLVHFHVRKTTDSSDLKNWTVCLSPGDVWTASFTNVGGNTQISTTDLSTTSVGFPLTITGQTQGYIEAVAVDMGTSKQHGCTLGENPYGTVGDSGHDLSTTLFGEAFFVSLGAGLSNGYNATAINNFQDLRGDDEVVVNSIKSTIFPTSSSNTAQKRVFFALTHPSLYTTAGSLASRWILDSAIGLDTQLVVTFPVGNVTLKPVADFGFPDFDNCSNCTHFNFNIPATMALWLWNDEEDVDGQSPRQVPMGKEVNVLTLSNLISTGAVHLPTPTDTGGWMRLMNDLDENQFVDAVRGLTCSASSPGDTCINAAGTLSVRYVPAMLPVVGFSILTAPPQFSALLPWKMEVPAALYDCPIDADGFFGQCTGVDLDPSD